MFDIGMLELLVIAVVALIVVGPKDLPGMFRTLGKFTAKARAMAREFQTSLEAAADEAGVADVTKTLKEATNLKNMGLDGVKEAASSYAELDFENDSEESKPDVLKADAAIKAKAKSKTPAAKKPAAKKPAAKKTAAKPKATVAKKPAAKPKAAAKKPPTKPKVAAAKKPAVKTAAKAKATAKPKAKAKS